MSYDALRWEPRLQRLLLIGLCALFVVALLGLPSLRWETQPSEKEQDLWILLAELKDVPAATAFKSIRTLDQYARAVYGESNVYSPLSNYIDTKPQPRLQDLESAAQDEAEFFTLRTIDTESRIFRVLITPRVDQEKEPFPENLREEFRNLSWVQASPDASVWKSMALQEQGILIPIVVTLFVGALRLALNSWVAALGAILTSALTTIIVFGWMGWFDISLNLLLLAIPITILAIGTSEDIHLVAYAQRDKSSGLPIGKTTLSTHRMAISCTAITTATGFAALTAGGHSDIQKFALVGTLSVALRFGILHLVFPLICKALAAQKRAPSRRFASYFGERIWTQNLLLSKRYKFLFTCGIGCLVGSVILGSIIQPSVVPSPLLKLSAAPMSNFEQHQKAFGGKTIGTFMVSGIAENKSLSERLNSLEQLHSHIEESIPGLQLMSELDFWKKAIFQISGKIPQDWSSYSSEYFAQVGLISPMPSMFQPAANTDAIPMRMIAFNRVYTADTLNYLKQIDFLPDGSEIRIKLNDDLQEILDQYQKFRYTLVSSTFITSTLICILIGLIYMSSVAAATTLFCNLLPAACVSIGICALGIPISPVTSLFVSLSLGVAVNDTLYLLSTYHHSIQKYKERETAVKETLKVAAYPILISTCTLSIAFLALTFSEFREIAFLGIIISLVLFSAMFCDLWVTPVLFLKIRIIPIWEILSKEYMGVIKGRTPIFKNMPARYIRKFIYFGRIQKADIGSEIFTEDQEGHTCIIILSGSCIVSKRGLIGSVFVSRLRPGDIAGELSLERASKRSATITADDTVDYIEFDWEQLDSFRIQYPKAASHLFFNLSQIISKRLRGTLHDLASSSHPFPKEDK